MSGYRPTTVEDIEYLIDFLRAEDVAECAACDLSPAQALRAGFRDSDWCRTIINNEKTPVAIFGLREIEPNRIGAPWLLGTDDLPSVSIPFLRQCRQAVDDLMLSEYPVLFNFAMASNKLHVRWLKWCGFELFPPVVLGNYDTEFIPFRKIRPDV